MHFEIIISENNYTRNTIYLILQPGAHSLPRHQHPHDRHPHDRGPLDFEGTV